MTITPYCSIDQWAIKKDYASFNAYSVKNKSPDEGGLTEMLEEMTSLMNEEAGSEDEDINLTGHATYLRNLCYRGVELMRDEEQARGTEENRSQFIPRDYMFGRDREKLRRYGLEEEWRTVGGVGV